MEPVTVRAASPLDQQRPGEEGPPSYHPDTLAYRVAARQAVTDYLQAERRGNREGIAFAENELAANPPELLKPETGPEMSSYDPVKQEAIRRRLEAGPLMLTTPFPAAGYYEAKVLGADDDTATKGAFLGADVGNFFLGAGAGLLAPSQSFNPATGLVEPVTGFTPPKRPPYDGKTSHGVLMADEGQTTALRSGNPDPEFANYKNAGHLEGKASIILRKQGSTGGTLYINNTNGICGICDDMTETLLPEGVKLVVVPPDEAVPNNSSAIATPRIYVGNPKPVKPNPRLMSKTRGPQ